MTVLQDTIKGSQNLYLHTEWLAEMYPRHELEVKGKAWAECLGILNSITKTLKTDTTPAKKSSPKVPWNLADGYKLFGWMFCYTLISGATRLFVLYFWYPMLLKLLFYILHTELNMLSDKIANIMALHPSVVAERVFELDFSKWQRIYVYLFVLPLIQRTNKLFCVSHIISIQF